MRKRFTVTIVFSNAPPAPTAAHPAPSWLTPIQLMQLLPLPTIFEAVISSRVPFVLAPLVTVSDT